MRSWAIFRRAIMLIVDDLGAALRISALPYAVFTGVSVWLAGTLDLAAIAQMEPDAMAAALPAGLAWRILLAALVSLAAFLWIAVAWHRYVLLREGGDGWIPPLEGRLLLGYLGRLLLISLIVLAAVMIVTVAIAPFAPGVSVALSIIVGMVLFYRLGLILPAGAIGRPITVAEAWRASQGQSGTVVLVALMTSALSFLFELPALLDASGTAGTVVASPGPIGFVYDLVVTWILLMLGVTVLSTLYGHFVEGRAVD